jgi:hypothetical protein
MKKRLALLIGIILSPAVHAGSTDCMSNLVNLPLSERPQLEDSLAWVRAVRSAAQCMGNSEMLGTLDSTESAIIRQMERQKNPGRRSPCQTSPMQTITRGGFSFFSHLNRGSSSDVYPDPAPKEAKAILVREPEYDSERVLLGYHLYLNTALRVDTADVGREGMIFAAGASPDGVAFLGRSGWQTAPAPVSCRPPEMDQAKLKAGAMNASVQETLASIDLDGLPPDLRQQLQGQLDRAIRQGEAISSTKRSSPSSQRTCTEAEMVRDTMPAPLVDTPSLPAEHRFSIRLGYEPAGGAPSFCRDKGLHSFYVAYGAMSDQDYAEIERLLALEDTLVPALEELKSTAIANQQYGIIADIDHQIEMIRVRAKRLKRMHESDLLRKKHIYNDGYQNGQCWQVATYNCPAPIPRGGG